MKIRPTGYYALEYAWEHEYANVVLLCHAVLEIKNARVERCAGEDCSRFHNAVDRAIELAEHVHKES